VLRRGSKALAIGQCFTMKKDGMPV
jgi:hypothetical protein